MRCTNGRGIRVGIKKTKEKNITFDVIYYGKRMTLIGKIVFIYYFILLVLPRVYSLTVKKTSVVTLYLLIADEADTHAHNGNYPHTLYTPKNRGKTLNN